MMRIYRLQELDCANCARKMQDAIQKIDGVHSASVNFMAQKLSLDMDESRADAIISEIGATIARIEPNCRLIP